MQDGKIWCAWPVLHFNLQLNCLWIKVKWYVRWEISVCFFWGEEERSDREAQENFFIFTKYWTFPYTKLPRPLPPTFQTGKLLNFSPFYLHVRNIHIYAWTTDVKVGMPRFTWIKADIIPFLDGTNIQFSTFFSIGYHSSDSVTINVSEIGLKRWKLTRTFFRASDPAPFF
jgi:hypothetical protein